MSEVAYDLSVDPRRKGWARSRSAERRFSGLPPWSACSSALSHKVVGFRSKNAGFPEQLQGLIGRFIDRGSGTQAES